MPASKIEEIAWQLEMLRLLPADLPGKSYKEIHKELEFLGFNKNLRTAQRTLPGLENSCSNAESTKTFITSTGWSSIGAAKCSAAIPPAISVEPGCCHWLAP